MPEAKEYSDKALSQIKEGKVDDACLTLKQAFNDLNPTKFKDVIDKMTKSNKEVEVEATDTYQGVPNFPKTVTLHHGSAFGGDATLFRRK